MNGRLFLHIGPPKTATTAMQYAFEEIDNKALVYGGTFQPRERNADSLSDILLRAANSNPPKEPRELEGALEEIAEHVRAGKAVVISEEMLSLSTARRSMTDKLSFLGQCFGTIPTTVILGVRDPLDAIPSLYQEIFKSQPLLTKLSFSRFCESNAIECYDYRKIISILQDSGLEKVKIVGFEDICSGSLALQDLLSHPDLPETQLNLRKVNTSQVKGKTMTRKLEPISLAMLGRTRVIRKLRKMPPFHGERLAQHVAVLARSIRIPNSEFRKLSIPDEKLRHYQKSYRFAQAFDAKCAGQSVPDQLRNIG